MAVVGHGSRLAPELACPELGEVDAGLLPRPCPRCALAMMESSTRPIVSTLPCAATALTWGRPATPASFPPPKSRQ